VNWAFAMSLKAVSALLANVREFRLISSTPKAESKSRRNALTSNTFDLQDEIALQIIRELEPELTRAELTLIQRQRPDNLDAWSRYRQALGAMALKGWNEEALAQTITHLRGAVPSIRILRWRTPWWRYWVRLARTCLS